MSRATADRAAPADRATADHAAAARVTLFCADAEATAALGVRLGQLLAGADCVALNGGLGAGKTTLVQGIVAGMGSRERATSPTFTLVNEYQGRAAPPGRAPLLIYHVDLYRLAEGAAPDVALLAATLGLDDVIGADDAVLLVEWADLDPALLPPDHLQVTLTAPDSGGRLVELAAAAAAPRAQALVAALR